MASVSISASELKKLNEAALIALLDVADRAAVLTVWASCLPELEHASAAFVERFASLCEGLSLWEELNEQGYLDEESPWSATRVGLWCMAKGLRALGLKEEAFSVYQRAVDGNALPPMRLCLDASRMASKIDQTERAIEWLSRGVRVLENYGDLQKAALLYRRLEKKAAVSDFRVIRCALLLTGASQLLQSILYAKALSFGLKLEFLVPDFNNVEQVIYDEDSELYHFQPDVVILGESWRDLNFENLIEDPDAWVSDCVSKVHAYWSVLTERLNARILQHTYDLPVAHSDGHLSASTETGRVHCIRSVNASLVKQAPEAVVLIDLEGVQSRAGNVAWSDERMWHLARQQPAPDALPFLVSEHLAVLRAYAGQTKKALILDLDNTLWRGVIGEDGLEGIRVGPEFPEGAPFRDFQEYLLELKARGILLAVCSKNNEEDARLPFADHDGMLIQLDDFVAFKANWNPKHLNLERIAEELNLGLDSFVFIDDNPAERELIRSQLPEVTVVEMPEEPADYIAALDRGRWFEVLSVSQEDRMRSQTYLSEAGRRDARKAAPSLEEYLNGLGMRARSGPFDELRMNRIAQLIQRTNQFNLTSRRHSLEDLMQIADSPKYWTQWFTLTDRFGDQGLVGLAIAELKGPEWHLDSLLMSCRVIGRGFEDYILNCVAESAKEAGASALLGAYVATRKNAQVADFYSQRGFTECKALGEGAALYSLDLAEYKPTQTAIQTD